MKAKKVNEGKGFSDYTEAAWKIDKFMPEDPELQDEYYKILGDTSLSPEEKYEEIAEFLKIMLLLKIVCIHIFQKMGQ
jgi:hypothetical protein